MRKINHLLLCAAMTAGLLATACSDWTEVEPVKQKPSRPSEQNPELWAQYTAALREYKKSDHTLIFASFSNGAAVATSEKDCLRSLPDSLDIVSLTRADHISEYDVEDMAVLQEKGIRVVWFVDYATRSEEFQDLAALGNYLDKVIAKVNELGLDGFSFSGIPIYGTAEEQAAQQAVAALFIEKFSPLAGPGKGKLLLFEGDPQFLAAADRAKVDYFVLDTKDTDNASTLKMQVFRALGATAIPREKLLIAARTESEFIDEDKVNSNSIEALTMRVVELGPLAGLCIYDVNQDYFGTETVYSLTRNAIQTLNPSK